MLSLATSLHAKDLTLPGNSAQTIGSILNPCSPKGSAAGAILSANTKQINCIIPKGSAAGAILGGT